MCDSYKKNLIISTQQAVVAVTQEPFISSHMVLFKSIRDGYHDERLIIHSLSFLPIPIFFYSQFFLHHFLHFHHIFTLLLHLSLMYYFHFTALYLSCSPVLLPRCQPTCLLPNVRSAFISLDHPSQPPYSSPLSLCGHPMHPLFFHPHLDTHSPLCLPLYLL